MAERPAAATPGDVPGAAPANDPDGAALQAALAGWRARGAARTDPVRWALVEALARRAAARPGAAGALLQARVRALLGDFAARHAQAQAAAEADAQALGRHRPDAADAAARLLADGDFAALRRQAAAAGLPRPAARLAALVERLGQAAPDTAAAPAGAPDAAARPLAELRTLSAFRGTWSRLRLDQRLRQSLAQAPEQAGPLHSHSLVLRALRLMREVSPGYLHRLMAQLDTLVWLEQAASAAPAEPRNVLRGDAPRPRRPARGRGG